MLYNPDRYAVVIGRSWHDSQAEKPLNTWIALDEHIIEECEGDLAFVSNLCESEAEYEVVFRSGLKESSRPGTEDDVFLPKSYVYFEIGQVDVRYRDYVETANTSDEPFIEPKLDPGNAQGGYGFIVGWNPVPFRYNL